MTSGTPCAHQRRETDESGTVEVAPPLSQRTVVVPALASTARTLPISPVARFRTCPAGSGVEVLSTGRDSARLRSRRSAGRGSGAGAGRRRAGTGSGFLSTFSRGTTFAPVPFVSVSRTHVFFAISV
jgi:hypothetical protein